MLFETITVTTIETACWITLNRPKALNAISSLCVHECLDALQLAEVDPAVRTIVFAGSGEEAFTSGADISELENIGPADGLRFSHDWMGLLAGIEKCRKPVIGAVKGWVIGGGAELLLACDFVICAESARYGFSEIDLGLIPGAGAVVRLTRWLGRLRAKELLMFGRLLSGAEMVEWQLANRCVADSELLSTAQAMANDLGARAQPALSAAKASVNVSAKASYDMAMEFGSQEFVRLIGSDDSRRRIRTFIERRKRSRSVK